MKQPFLSGIRLWLREHVSPNLKLIIALFAAAFAGWAAYDAQETRKDALAGLKISQRSYVGVRNHQVGYSDLPHGGEKRISYRHTLAAYGASPAFQVSEDVTCVTGSESKLKGRLPAEDDLAFFRSIREQPATKRPGPHHEFRSEEPDELPPGGSYKTSGYLCDPLPAGAGQTRSGTVAFGKVTYKDIFGETHYKLLLLRFAIPA